MKPKPVITTLIIHNKAVAQVNWGIDKEIPRKIVFEEVKDHRKKATKQTSLSDFILEEENLNSRFIIVIPLDRYFRMK